MSNCVFARRRYVDSGIPVIIFGYKRDDTTNYYLTINGVNYTLGDTPPNVYAGDSIFVRAGSVSAYLNGTQVASGSSGGTFTVPVDAKKLVVAMYDYSSGNRGIRMSTNPNYVVYSVHGTNGQATNCWTALNNDTTNYKLYEKRVGNTTVPLTSIAFAIKAGTNDDHLAGVGTINGVEVYRNTDYTNPATSHVGNVAVASGILGLDITHNWNAQESGSITITAY